MSASTPKRSKRTEESGHAAPATRTETYSPISTPRLMRPRLTTVTAGLLARGSPPIAAFPVSQWHAGEGLAAYSCGGSRGIARKLTAFPFDTPKGDRREENCQNERSGASLTAALA